MLLFLVNLFIILSCIIYMVLHKKSTIIVISICVIASVVFVLQIIDISSQSKNIELSNNFLESVLKKEMTNKENLINMGFEYQSEYYILHYDSDETLCSIIVTFDEKDPSLAKHYKSISYEAYETRIGILNPERLFMEEVPLIRRCIFYMDGIKIMILEDNVENSQLSFEEYFTQNP